MILKYDMEVGIYSININLNRLTNQIFKLLPLREEKGDWQKPLETILEELAGMDRLFIYEQPDIFKLMCKLEGLFSLTQDEDFILYRSIIFECLGIIGELKKCLQNT